MTDENEFDPIVMIDASTGEVIREGELNEIIDRVGAEASMGILPPYWQHEVSGLLRPAIEALIYNGAAPDKVPPPTEEQIKLIAAYFQIYIDAPCWQGGAELKALRESARELQTLADVHNWLRAASAIAIDPL